MEDLVSGNRFWWHGKHGTIRLDPYEMPFLIWRVHLPRASA
jgi:starch synthase (maltosyl-transferring)